MYNKLSQAVSYIRTVTDFKPKIALILGSGLGAFADEVEAVASINYSDIPSFPVSTVEGHKGRFVFCRINGVPTVIMQGRVHYYEGYDMSDVVVPVRIMKLLGAEILFLTNAAGAINSSFQPGDFMILKDHISSFIPSALMGKNVDEMGIRFPDMSNVYDNTLISIIKNAAAECNIDIKEGVYLQTTGPQFETPAEIKAYKIMGADAVGMSTVCEAISAVHCDMKVCAVSCCSNMASGISKQPLTHAEVQQTADMVAPLFKKLIKKSITEMGKINE